MSEKKPLADRVRDVLKGEGGLHIDEIAKRADTTKNSLSTIIGSMKGVRRVSRGVYALAGNQMLKAREFPRDALATGGELGRKKVPPINGSPRHDSLYAPALEGLKARRSTLLSEVAKLEGAISALEALA